MNSVEWNDGMKRWNGALDWTTGVPRSQIGHAHNTKLFQARDCTKCMSQGSLAAQMWMSSIESRVADLVRIFDKFHQQIAIALCSVNAHHPGAHAG